MQVQCEILPNATCGDNFCSPQHELIRFAVLGFILAVFKKKIQQTRTSSLSYPTQ